jgi:dTDP-4-dehydrorhamnose 3,5-epimerase
MNVIKTDLEGLLVIEPNLIVGNRGLFNQTEFSKATGVKAKLRQGKHSRFVKGALCGLHYQINCPHGKLVRVTVGNTFDVAVDLRRTSPTFGKWLGLKLSAGNKRQLWIPPGFAHGFIVLSDSAERLCKTLDHQPLVHERCIIWNDPYLAIKWPEGVVPSLSLKDQRGVSFKDAELF